MRFELKRLAPLLVAIFIAGPLYAETQSQTSEINIFFTGDVQGNFEPCGCAGGPTGGVARRVGYCNHYIEENGGLALHIDAGNYFASPGQNSKQINSYLKKSLTAIPLEVMNLGSDDLYWWKGLSRFDYAETHFISTNLVPKRDSLETPDRYAIIEFPSAKLGLEKPVRIAFLGLVDPRLVKPNSGFRALDPLKSIRDIKSEVLAKSDFIIVLWDMMRPQGTIEDSIIEELALEHKEIYSIITTEKRFVLYDPVQINSAIILSSVERGRYVGRLGLGFDESGQVVTVEPEFFEMHEEVPEDPSLAAQQRKISRLVH